MKCFLTVPDAAGEAGSPARRCLALFPLLDRPFLQHVVEYLAGRGVTDVQFVLGRGADAVERALGDGTRWGATFRYHLTRDPDRPGCVLGELAATAGGGPILLGRADLLPQLPAALPAAAGNVLFHAGGKWTGWAVIHPADLAGLPKGAGWADIEARLTGPSAETPNTGPPLKLRSLEDVLAAQKALLRNHFPGLLHAAREVRTGVWAARNVKLSPAAVVVPPVFLDENTTVEARSRVGPYTVVGANCLLAGGSAVKNTTVLPASYVGPGMKLNGVIVDGRYLTSPKRQQTIVADPNLLSSLAHQPPLDALSRLAGRLLAGVVFVAALPLLAVVAAWLAARRGQVLWGHRFARPADLPGDAGGPTGVVYTFAPPRPEEDDVGWIVRPSLGSLVLEILPALAAIATGRLRLVGLTPRGAAPLKGRPPAPSDIPAGLVTEAGLVCRKDCSAEDVLFADVYQSHTATLGANVWRVVRFAARALTP